MPATEILQWSFDNVAPGLCWTFLADGEPVLMAGCCENPSRNTGIPWILGSNDLVKAANELKTVHEFYLKKMLERFDRLESIVDTRNMKAIKYAQKCGFKFLGPFSSEKSEVPFFYIVLTKECLKWQ